MAGSSLLVIILLAIAIVVLLCLLRRKARENRVKADRTLQALQLKDDFGKFHPVAKPEPLSPATNTEVSLSANFDLRDDNTESFLLLHVGERTWPGILDDPVRERLRAIFAQALKEKTGALGMTLGVRDSFPHLSPGQAEDIAKTELALALNCGSCKGYLEGDVEAVLVMDGCGCDKCAAVDGMTISTKLALRHPLQHVGCVRSFQPVPGDIEKGELQNREFVQAVKSPKTKAAPDGRKIFR
jgi:hypothetical protein